MEVSCGSPRGRAWVGLRFRLRICGNPRRNLEGKGNPANWRRKKGAAVSLERENWWDERQHIELVSLAESQQIGVDPTHSDAATLTQPKPSSSGSCGHLPQVP